MKRLASGVVVVLFVLLVFTPGRAHETDPYTVPLGRQYADLGPHLTAWFHGVLSKSVDQTNRRISEAVERGDERLVAELQSPDGIVTVIAGNFPNAYSTIEGFERLIYTDEFRKRYPGQIGGYKELFTHTYQHAHPLWDFRQVFKFWFASTIKAFGVYFGNDKLGHFIDMGRHYYFDYRKALASGMSEEEAMWAAQDKGINHPIFSESGVCGMVSSGTYSNADLMSNYAGFLFYRNVTEPIRLKGVVRPPLLQRDGPYWKLAPHVRPTSDFLSWFFSDHFDEALNPNFYDPIMRPGILKAMRQRADGILHRYSDELGRRRNPDWFTRRARELRTYYGDNYGHKGDDESLITVPDALYESLDSEPTLADRNSAGYTALHMAVLDGDAGRVQQLLEAGADPNVRSASARIALPDNAVTPLHLAAREGHADIARMLIDVGAHVTARSETGVTPLHWAGSNPAIVTMLLNARAAANVADASGATPAHWMAAGGEPGLAVLLKHGGAVDAEDRNGQTPLHQAAAMRQAGAVTTLLNHGANAVAADDFGVTPLHLAAGRGDEATIQVLVGRGGQADLADKLGRTPLHRAARAGRADAARLLVQYGADANRADRFGTRPLHLAARYASPATVAALLDGGAEAVCTNAAGVTPLHEAAFGGDAGAIATLLRHGSDPDAKDGRGFTALRTAIQRGNTGAAAELRGQPINVYAMPR